MFSLTATHLRFVCEALTSVRLSGYNAESQLRGALGNVMRRVYCAAYPPSPKRGEGLGVRGDPAHTATCPVCWLLAADEHPGEERRGYTLLPPLNPPDCYAPGERISFGVLRILMGDNCEPCGSMPAGRWCRRGRSGVG